MKRKGFTLIELLAVIVILAIIAVITVPKIADMISSSRQGGAEDSFYGTLKAAELGYTKALQSNTNLKGSTCTIENSKITCINEVNVEVSGKTPESGTLTIDSAGSTIAKALTLNGYKCYGDLSTSNPCVKADVDVASESLIKKVTTSGDGLYKDTYEEGRYVYKGTNPNNYLTFNNEEAGWRIVAIEADGTLKIIRASSIGSKTFDKETLRSASSNGAGGTYCFSSKHGCNAWAINNHYINGNINGTVLLDAQINTYLNVEYYNSIKNMASMIQNYNYSTGSVSFGGNNLTIIVKDEKKILWNGNIALITISDYLKSNSNNNCNSINYVNSNNDSCKVTNYLTPENGIMWLMTPNYGYNHCAFRIDNNGNISAGTNVNNNYNIFPVVHLKSNLQLTGNGTSEDPYKIV